jgi:hypothetical protein
MSPSYRKKKQKNSKAVIKMHTNFEKIKKKRRKLNESGVKQKLKISLGK